MIRRLPGLPSGRLRRPADRSPAQTRGCAATALRSAVLILALSLRQGLLALPIAVARAGLGRGWQWPSRRRRTHLLGALG